MILNPTHAHFSYIYPSPKTQTFRKQSVEVQSVAVVLELLVSVVVVIVAETLKQTNNPFLPKDQCLHPLPKDHPWATLCSTAFDGSKIQPRS